MDWTVKTLDEAAFEKACHRLEKMIIDDSFIPCMVLSIRNGGLFVGKRIFKNARHYSALRRRPSSKFKGKIAKYIIQLLPRKIQDRLRICEARRLSNKSTYKENNIDEISLELDIDKAMEFDKILIVDDAVDSGQTLEYIHRTIQNLYPKAMIRTAVITVTTSTPLIAPDYTLYNNHTLIRFPWSIDF